MNDRNLKAGRTLVALGIGALALGVVGVGGWSFAQNAAAATDPNGKARVDPTE